MQGEMRTSEIRDTYQRAFQLAEAGSIPSSAGPGGTVDLLAKARAYAQVVQELRRDAFLPHGQPLSTGPGPRVEVELLGRQRSLIMLASNDYLNLSTDPRVHVAARDALDRYGVGGGSSRVNAGYTLLHRELEDELASRYGKEAALLLPTGFDAVAGTIQALAGPGDRVLADGSSHACILDGARASGATVRCFAHNRPDRLQAALVAGEKSAPAAGVLVVVEGAYSMDGDAVRLGDLVPVCQAHGARLLVDEAHAIGVLGERGLGAAEAQGVLGDVDLLAGTFSKSLGATGGFLVADRDVITFLTFQSRKSVFSATMAPPVVAAAQAAWRILDQEPERRRRLWDNVRRLIAGLEQQGVPILGRGACSVPVLVGDEVAAFEITRELVEEGVFTFPAVYPTVPRGRALFRLAVQAGHEAADLDHVAQVLGRCLRARGLAPAAAPPSPAA